MVKDVRRRRTAFLCALAAASLVCPRTARAYRPFDGTDGDVADTGDFELEIGPAYLAGRSVRPALDLPATVFNFGVFPRAELVIDVKHEVDHETRGGFSPRLVDDDVQLKYLLREGCLQKDSGLSVATENGVLLPYAGETGGFGLDGNLIASQCLGFLTLHYNVGVWWNRAGQAEVEGSVIFDGPAELRVRPVGELLADHAFGGQTTFSALAGVIWPASDALVWDAATRAGLLDGEPFVELRLGLTWTVRMWGERAAE